MDPWTAAAKFLQTFGPYAILVFLGWWHWHKDKEHEAEKRRRDKEIRELSEQIIGLVAEQTAGTVKFEAALTGLKEVITMMMNKK